MYNRDDSIQNYLYAASNERGCGRNRTSNKKATPETREIAIDNPGCGLIQDPPSDWLDIP